MPPAVGCTAARSTSPLFPLSTATSAQLTSSPPPSRNTTLVSLKLAHNPLLTEASSATIADALVRNDRMALGEIEMDNPTPQLLDVLALRPLALLVHTTYCFGLCSSTKLTGTRAVLLLLTLCCAA